MNKKITLLMTMALTVLIGVACSADRKNKKLKPEEFPVFSTEEVEKNRLEAWELICFAGASSGAEAESKVKRAQFLISRYEKGFVYKEDQTKEKRIFLNTESFNALKDARGYLQIIAQVGSETSETTNNNDESKAKNKSPKDTPEYQITHEAVKQTCETPELKSRGGSGSAGGQGGDHPSQNIILKSDHEAAVLKFKNLACSAEDLKSKSGQELAQAVEFMSTFNNTYSKKYKIKDQEDKELEFPKKDELKTFLDYLKKIAESNNDSEIKFELPTEWKTQICGGDSRPTLGNPSLRANNETQVEQDKSHFSVLACKTHELKSKDLDRELKQASLEESFELLTQVQSASDFLIGYVDKYSPNKHQMPFMKQAQEMKDYFIKLEGVVYEVRSRKRNGNAIEDVSVPAPLDLPVELTTNCEESRA